MRETYPPTPRTVNLPQFWPHNPRGWFDAAELEFLAAGYPPGGHACYIAVLRALPTDIHIQVQDITNRLTADEPEAYHHLKAALLTRFALSPLQASFQLLEHPGMGARTPMRLFTDLQRLVPPRGDTLLNAIFLQRLPDRLRDVLTAKAHLSPHELAEEAMAIYNAYSAAVVAE